MAAGGAFGLGFSYVNWGNVGNFFGDLFEGHNPLLNISIVISSKNIGHDKGFKQMDKKDDGGWHYIVVKSITEGEKRLKKYLKGEKAETVILDGHGGSGMIIVNENDEAITKTQVENYPNSGVKKADEAIKSLISIGNSIEANGNLVVTACDACAPKNGDGIGKALSTLIKNKRIYMSTQFSPATISKQGDKFIGTIGRVYNNISSKAFFNGASLGAGILKVRKAGALTFKFSNPN